MPTLHWIGKDKIINHHRDVPFRILEHQYTFSSASELKNEQNSGNPDNSANSDADKSSGLPPTQYPLRVETASGMPPTVETANGNKIIHGDNLEALKSLLPEYEGKIKCIYIDPPYNTGNESWVYNDNVNHPKIKKWLGDVVGKEGEDLSRHDKWLCMMYPRLKLLHKLLAADGAIFISIDDNEQANLKLMMDEVFGLSNYLTSFVWKRRSGSNDAKNFLSNDHEYVVCYQKTDKVVFKGIGKSLKNYKNPNNDPRGPWAPDNLTCGKTKEERPNLFYDLIDPKTNQLYNCNPNRVWVYEKERMQRMIDEDKVIFPKNGDGTPQYKRHLSELRHLKKPLSSWILPSTEKSEANIKASINSTATKEVRLIFKQQVFSYPKPTDLVQNLVSQITDKNSIILDSFAGSGTTAHAVLNLNKQDGGNRTFILIEMEDYAESITAERVKRVIKGYGEGSRIVAGTGGSFDYYTLGQALFDENENLNETVGRHPAGIDNIRQYIWFSETRTAFTEAEPIEGCYFLGKKEDTAYYFIYEQGHITTLDYAFLSTIKTKSQQYVIYADNCLLTKDFMTTHHIVFKKIPRDISRF